MMVKYLLTIIILLFCVGVVSADHYEFTPATAGHNQDNADGRVSNITTGLGGLNWSLVDIFVGNGNDYTVTPTASTILAPFLRASGTTNKYNTSHVSELKFNTTPLPDDFTTTAAYIQFYAGTTRGYNTAGNMTLEIVESHPYSNGNSTLAAADYQGRGKAPLTTNLSYTDWHAGNNTLTFLPSGYFVIDPTGMTRLVGTSSWDVYNSSDGLLWGLNNQTGFNWEDNWTTGAAFNGKRPRLIVEGTSGGAPPASPPQPITNLTATVTGCHNATITWTDPSDVDLKQVNVWSKDTFFKSYSAGTETMCLMGLNESKTYFINTTTEDTDGNINATWTNTSFTTSACATPLIAAFSGTPTSGGIPLSVQFTDESVGDGIYAWYWDFNNDGVVDSYDSDPLYNYTTIGYYTVNLTVFGAISSDSEVKNNYINASMAIPLDTDWTFANGCWTKTSGAYTLVKWVDNGTFTYKIPAGVYSVRYLNVAGGSGAGGSTLTTPSGAGAGGGVLNGTTSVTPMSTIILHVGKGGPGGVGQFQKGSRGEFSSINNTINATEGGEGGATAAGFRVGGDGGSGGGTVYDGGLGGLNMSGQGFIGGAGYILGNQGSGGAGGAAEPGQNGSVADGGTSAKGGDGRFDDITGDGDNYWGPGGGGSGLSGNPGPGGLGGGGKGTVVPLGPTYAVGQNGTPNKGAGGGGIGGASAGTGVGGSGSDGIIVIKFLTPSVYPIASFIPVGEVTGYDVVPVQFLDMSSVTPTTWNWSYQGTDVGNNTRKIFAMEQNPIVSFGIGNFSVFLNVSNSYGYGDSSQSTWINVSSDPNPGTRLSFQSTTSKFQITNQTPYTETVVISEIVNTTSVRGNITWNPLYMTVKSLSVNNTEITGMTLSESAIDSSGFATFNVTKPTGIMVQTCSTVIVDFDILYHNYAEPDTVVYFGFNSNTSTFLPNGTPIYHLFNSSIGSNEIVGTWENPVAAFAANKTDPIIGTMVLFNESSTGHANSWLWSFGDGNTSTSRNTSHVYITSGLKTVSLQAYLSQNGTVSSTETKVNYINVTALDSTITPDFFATPTQGTPSLFVAFTDVSFVQNKTNLAYNWCFGDGQYSNTVGNVNHVYAWAGIYSVKLSINNTALIDGIPTNGGAIKERLDYIVASNQVSTTFYSPKTVSFHIVDEYGNSIQGAAVVAKFNQSNLPPTTVSWLTSNFGMNAQAASEVTNTALNMSGLTSASGDIAYVMVSAIEYDMTITYKGTTNYFLISPGSGSYQLRFVTAVGPDTSLATCVYANGNTHTGLAAPDPYNMTMMWSYQDTCGLTTSLDYIVEDKNNNSFIIYNYHLAPITTGIYVNNLTVPNIRGQTYTWYENTTRSV